MYIQREGSRSLSGHVPAHSVSCLTTCWKQEQCLCSLHFEEDFRSGLPQGLKARPSSEKIMGEGNGRKGRGNSSYSGTQSQALNPPETSKGLPAFSACQPLLHSHQPSEHKDRLTLSLLKSLQRPQLGQPCCFTDPVPQPGGTLEPQSHQALPNPAETNCTPVTLYLLFPWLEPPGSVRDQPLGKGFLDVSRPVLLINGSTQHLPEN